MQNNNNPPPAGGNNGSVFNKLKAKGVSSVSNLRDNLAKKGSIAIFVILALLTIAVLMAFLVIKLKSVNTKGTLIIADPLKLYGMSSQVRVDANGIPPTVDGQEFSISLWLYLVDYIPTPDGPQLILMRASDGSSLSNASPIVAMDANTNTLYVSIKTSASAAAQSSSFMKPLVSGYLTSKVDYFPLQRWVNIVAAVKDDSMSLYLNSSLYTVSNVNELIATGSTTTRARPVFSPCTGSMYVGPAGVTGVRDPRAYIAQFKFFNYALTPKDISAIYANGPSSSTLLTKMGLSGYGIRSPFYRLNA